ncbi:MAG TPA: lysylphosphatidylglycerol synthase transmembrane domain-containing protein [Saprospiraceae bacterium]|nr:flippase-like domain-containing protein [Saprospiraceae bacterium]MBX7178982.1 flippase-like domain-containing protein [Saprospiraceae bacterium]MCB0590748.1 flippase-like domain-containing protein [Saprospiraceae bacterium]MCO5284665.1 flippase-like domain-containing protein [Saprospiraceae bacterium]MCO6471823.1 flippase-like domain-containing protein [Saprospiraceae bacterium]
MTFEGDDKKAIRSLRVSKVIWPILIGVGVVGYLFWKQFDINEFNKIHWTRGAFIAILLSIGFMICKHLSYAMRLYILSEKEFSFLKCIQLIFIWEFSSAIAPTAVGGSAVALFALAQEKLSAARTTVIVIYTAILDSYFFVISLPILFMIFGPEMVRPGMKVLDFSTVAGSALLSAYIFKTIYSTLFLYGLFIDPRKIRSLLSAVTSLPLLNRWHDKAVKLGDDIILASGEMKGKSFRFHFGAIWTTCFAWIFRFLILVTLILGIIGGLERGWYVVLELYARVQTMFMVIMFSPSPGGSGIIEGVFGGFLSDYIPVGVALIIALLWRLISYYFYLFAGVIIVPNWLNKIISQRHKAEQGEQVSGD